MTLSEILRRVDNQTHHSSDNPTPAPRTFPPVLAWMW